MPRIQRDGTDNTDEPTCPYCGESDPEWWDTAVAGRQDGDTWVTTCEDCERDYKVELHKIISFSTEKVAAAKS